MESTLLTAAQQAPNCAVIYQETILDEDRIDAYKLLAIRCRVDG
jgi:effector-binding domain-containing protein